MIRQNRLLHQFCPVAAMQELGAPRLLASGDARYRL